MHASTAMAICARISDIMIEQAMVTYVLPWSLRRLEHVTNTGRYWAWLMMVINGCTEAIPELCSYWLYHQYRQGARTGMAI